MPFSSARLIKRLVTLAIAALGCRDHTAVDGPTPHVVTLVRLRAEPRSFLDGSDLRAPLRVVVRDDAEWKAMWSRIWQQRTDAPPLPAVDFTREMVVVAAAGAVASSGYDILVDSADVRDERVHLHVLNVRPGPRCGVRWVVMHPVDVATVSRTMLPIVFDERVEVRDCS